MPKMRKIKAQGPAHKRPKNDQNWGPEPWAKMAKIEAQSRAQI